MAECVVYWKHLPNMTTDYSDGYIGITTRSIEERNKEHYRDAFVRNSVYKVHDRMREYENKVITDIIFEGSIEECLDLENKLRPNWNMGWNMAIGGGIPGSGSKTSHLPNHNWLDYRLLNTNTYEEIHIKSRNDTKKLALRIDSKNGISGRRGNIHLLLEGRIPTIYNLEFANEQLANRIKERAYKKWTHVYLINTDNQIVSVYRGNERKFWKYFNKTVSGGRIKQLTSGRQKSIYNWELATEEEWFATSERIEFK